MKFLRGECGKYAEPPLKSNCHSNSRSESLLALSSTLKVFRLREFRFSLWPWMNAASPSCRCPHLLSIIQTCPPTSVPFRPTQQTDIKSVSDSDNLPSLERTTRAHHIQIRAMSDKTFYLCSSRITF